MDYNNGNNNNFNMGYPPGQGRPPMGNPQMGNPGMGYPPNQGRPPMGNPQMGNPGMGYPPGQGRPPMGNQPMGNPGMGNPQMGNPRTGFTPNAGRPASSKVPPLTSSVDETSKKLAREIEKSVNGENRNPLRGRTSAGKPGGGLNISLSPDIAAGIANFSAYIYGGVLVLCLVIALIAFGKDHKGTGGKSVSIPAEMLTYTGIFRDVYEAAASGSVSKADTGVLYNDDGTEVPPAPTAIGEEVPAATDSEDDQDEVSSGDSSDDSSASSSSGSFSQAESYKELLTQLESAIASGDTAFVASKMAYEDESGTLKAFPQTVVEHFVTYMSSNTDKLSSLMVDLGNDKYSGQSDGEFIVKLPYIKFVVNMGYDNTTVSLPGFSDQVVNAGQSADIAPLLPCMYTLTISNPDWNDVVTRDIEANINESTISINIKP